MIGFILLKHITIVLLIKLIIDFLHNKILNKFNSLKESGNSLKMEFRIQPKRV